MPTLLRVEGSWPGPITLSSGWFRARARPWNESVSDPMLRLDRGGAEFLDGAAGKLFDLGAQEVFSPALYGPSTRAWRRAGFDDFAHLDVMERPLSAGLQPPSAEVRLEVEPDWDDILDIDRSAFEGFWGMSRLGLVEARETSKTSAILVAGEHAVAGYAIVGSQWGVVYLHRVAVRPSDSGRGLGAALITASINWGAGTGSRSMILNVRPENQRAKALYRRLGFSDTSGSLQILRRQRSSEPELLN